MSKEMGKAMDGILRELKLPAVLTHRAEVASKAEREGWSFDRFLQHLVELELAQRHQRRLEKALRASKLPIDKTLATLDTKRLPAPVRRMLPSLCEGGFVGRAENLLAFGLPGRGKTHLVCAIGAELLQRGVSVHFTPAYALVQRLLAARKALAMEKELHRLDAFSVLIIDDIGYIQQDRDEMEVLFTLLAERYERRSVVLTSNLVFSQWDRIFKDPMTTAAAIDRVVHHSVILELTGPSFRAEAAKARSQDPEISTTA
jgi:DNA replication protein DnaC